MLKLLLLSAVLTATDAFATKPQELPAANCADAPDAVVAETAALLKAPSVASCAEVIATGLCSHDEAARLCCATCAASKGIEASEPRSCRHSGCTYPKWDMASINNAHTDIKRTLNRRASKVDYCMGTDGSKPVMMKCEADSADTFPSVYMDWNRWYYEPHLLFESTRCADSNLVRNYDGPCLTEASAQRNDWAWTSASSTLAGRGTYLTWPQIAVDGYMLEMLKNNKRLDGKWSAHFDKLVRVNVELNNNKRLDGFLLKSRLNHHCIGVGTGPYWPLPVMKSCDHNDDSQIWVLSDSSVSGTGSHSSGLPWYGRPQLINMIDHNV